jgi:hypothetical protein
MYIAFGLKDLVTIFGQELSREEEKGYQRERR